MSVLASSCNEICNAPTNTSKAKMLYTFSKASRFNSNKKVLCDRFYETDKKWVRRTTNFGYGNKYDFTTEAPVSPPPNTYAIRSDFSPVKKRGFGFGSSRQEMQITGPLVDTIKNKNPGPGSYHVPSSLDKTSYSLGKKYCQEDLWKKSIPGPGKYQSVNSLNEKGSYFLSKFKNSGVPTISMLRRKDLNISATPGPGKYSVHDGCSPQGKYVNSKHGSSHSRHFPKDKRSSLVPKMKTPGPGFYRLPSEFGYYESAKIKTEDKEN